MWFADSTHFVKDRVLRHLVPHINHIELHTFVTTRYSFHQFERTRYSHRIHDEYHDEIEPHYTPGLIPQQCHFSVLLFAEACQIYSQLNENMGHKTITFDRRKLRRHNMMTSSNGNIFRVTGPLCGVFTGHRRIPLKRASGAEFWCFLWYAPE